jgi:carboxylesterase type B
VYRADNRLDSQNQVLLFGQSAGAENAYVIASLPQAPSLFHSVISESGGGRGLINNATTQKVGASYAQALNCSRTDVSVPTWEYSIERADQ